MWELMGADKEATTLGSRPGMTNSNSHGSQAYTLDEDPSERHLGYDGDCGTLKSYYRKGPGRNAIYS